MGKGVLNMDLENFISVSLVQIAKGIDRANNELKGTGAIVSPKKVTDVLRENTYGNLKLNDGSWVRVQQIDFDVALTATEGGESKGGGGISVGAITLGAMTKDDFSQSTVSRIKFSVPMLLPQKDEEA